MRISGQLRRSLQALVRQNMDVIARHITLEQGKTFADARGDVLRGLQVVESMAAIPTMMMGDRLEVAQNMDTAAIRTPLGVGAAISTCSRRLSLFA
jgi:malonate-semialdehyde dehydrogenase (acetylating)/methylmalonate-semialdehyde dehydrogenase